MLAKEVLPTAVGPTITVTRGLGGMVCIGGGRNEEDDRRVRIRGEERVRVRRRVRSLTMDCIWVGSEQLGRLGKG